MITFKQTGDFKNTERFLTRAQRLSYLSILQKYGQQGVEALSSATPVDSGLTSNSWGYEIKVSRGSLKIYWSNTNVNRGALIAILIQYGHGTRNGGYIQGRDYINPAMQPIFDRMIEDVWKEVTK